VKSIFIYKFILQQPQSICTIEELSRVIVTKDDDISNSVSVFIAPDKLITFCMEDRDANEFAIVLAGYFRLIAGKCSAELTAIVCLLEWKIE
jgi:predicted nuclease of predicted toxin-antitoxin system